MFDLLPIGARTPLSICLAYFNVATGVAAIGFTLAVLRDRLPQRSPFASLLSDVPKVSDVTDKPERIWS
jgi:hypothetical protein